MPPGLWVRPLPFADDIRAAPETHLVVAPYNVIDKMRVVLQNLQLPGGVYDPRKYPNPALQWFFRILQALALEEDLPEQPEDKTLPKWRQIHKRVGGYVVEWGEELEAAFSEWEAANKSNIRPTATGGAKRGAAATAGKTSKKVKDEDDDENGIDDATIKKAYEKDQLAKFKVAELKSWCGLKGIAKGSTKKADFVDAIVGWFETKMEVD
jgi:ATP-dependent DNA helicase 2 subunit 1